MRGRKQEAPRVDPEQRAVVEEVLRRRTLNPREREWLAMVKARALGQEVGRIASGAGGRRGPWTAGCGTTSRVARRQWPMLPTERRWSRQWKPRHGT
jgi:hypothetical protein